MTERSSARLDRIFGAVADPTRRAILRQLAGRPHNVGELAMPHAMSLAAVSKHVKVLERAGLVTQTLEGRTRLCALDARPLQAANAWLQHYERFWNERLDALEALLESDATSTAVPAAVRRDEAAGKGRAPSRRRTRIRKGSA